MDLWAFTADDIAGVQAELNLRPRKVHGWGSPAERLATLLRSPSMYEVDWNPPWRQGSVSERLRPA